MIMPSARVALSALALTTALGAQPAFAKGATRHAAGDAELRRQVSALAAEVAALKAQLVAQREQQAVLQQQIAAVTRAPAPALAQTPSTLPSPPTGPAPAAVLAVALPPPGQPAPAGKWTVRPGGFAELAVLHRAHFQGADLASNFAIPFPNSSAAHTSETRLSARQSRASVLVQGRPDPRTTLSAYAELDFLGAAQTANSNESNSFNPRVRQFYATFDRASGGSGLHVLAGQSWSLVTAFTKGITPRSEAIPPVIDPQYAVGLAWTRQPQLRIAGETFDHRLWLAVSAENPATAIGGAVPSGVTALVPAGAGFNAANSLSLNHLPDLVGKASFDDTISGHALHLEGFGLSRSFSARRSGAGTAGASGFGYGGTVILGLVPGVLDLEASAMGGKGIGRYGSAQLSDVAFAADGSIHPIREALLLGIARLHPDPHWEVYGVLGEERQQALDLGNGYGIGLAGANNSGCETEGGTCTGNTREVRELIAGAWHDLPTAGIGRAQIGLQFSYTTRKLFEAIGGAPQADQTTVLISLRYTPF